MAKLFKANYRWLTVLTLTLVSMVNSSCTFRTPAPVVPVKNTNGEMIEKSFFFKNKQFKPGTCTDQNFMATWAAVDERGIWAEYYTYAGVPQKAHLNVFFCFTQDALVAYEINPSFPDQRAHAKEVITIPISKQYSLEPKKDGYQREVNEIIKNDDKDAFMHAPFMDLNFGGISVDDWAYDIVDDKPQVIDVSNIEWDMEKQFLGFTVEVKDSWIPQKAQARIRFNFMAYETKSEQEFPITPYDITLAKHINVLHILGRTLNGVDPQAYAGHWDVSKGPVTFYTHGVPADQMDIVQDVIDSWNRAFERAGVVEKGQKALVLNTNPIKYPVDLRYPVINWVTDKRQAMNSPLGIGIASSDVSNGEFKYGSVTVWTGYLEEIMNRYAVAETAYAGMIADAKFQNLDRRTFFDQKLLARSGIPDEGSSWSTLGASGAGLMSLLRSDDSYQKLSGALEILQEKADNLSSTAIAQIAANSDEYMNSESRKAYIDRYTAAISNPEIKKSFQHANEFMVSKMAYLDSLKEIDMEPAIKDQVLYDLLSIFHDQFSAELFEAPEKINRDPIASVMTDEQAAQLNQAAAQADIRKHMESSIQDLDRTFADVVPDMIAGMKASGRSEREILRATTKFLLLHELGHVLGLGHNFKGSILPQPEDVSKEDYAAVKKQLDEKGYVAHSVMDYYSARTEVVMNYEDVDVGIYDEQMLRYLYKREYPAKNVVTGELKYLPIAANGIVQDEAVVKVDGVKQKFKPAYMPECNDIEASTNVDPLCMRFDRGHNATEIMVNRFKDFNSSLVAMLNAFSSAKGSNVWGRQGMLWYRTLNEFAQIRSFYDYMRMQLDEQPQYKDAYKRIRDSQDALLAFSDACRDPNLAPTEQMRKDFAVLALKDPSKLGTPVDQLKLEDFTPIRDLCVANKYALDQFAELMKREGSDYPTFDRINRYVPGGMRGGDLYLDWGYIWGAYREVGAFPLRLSTLYMVTSPVPYYLYWGLNSIPLYNNPQGRYSYAPLYPREFSKVIDTTVRENLNLGGGVLEEKTEIGSTLMYLNYLMMRNRFYTKDNDDRFPSIYLENLNSLTRFDVSLSPIILANVTKEGKRDTLVFNYAATYIDFANRDAVAIPYAYLLTDRRVVAKGNEKQMFLPITKFRYLTDRWGYIWALDLKYYHKDDDPLKGYSVKDGLNRLAQEQLEACAQGSNGLSSFFNVTNEEFEGFEVKSGIATKPDLQRDFDNSVKKNYGIYYASALKPNPSACDDTIKNMNVIVGGAAMINGYWLPSAIKYLNF